MPSARELSRAITRRARAAMKGTPLWAERRRLRKGRPAAELDPRLGSAFLLIPALLMCTLAAPPRVEYALLVLALATAAGALLQGARLRQRLEGEAVVPYLHLPIADDALFALMVRRSLVDAAVWTSLLVFAALLTAARLAFEEPGGLGWVGAGSLLGLALLQGASAWGGAVLLCRTRWRLELAGGVCLAAVFGLAAVASRSPGAPFEAVLPWLPTGWAPLAALEAARGRPAALLGLAPALALALAPLLLARRLGRGYRTFDPRERSGARHAGQLNAEEVVRRLADEYALTEELAEHPEVAPQVEARVSGSLAEEAELLIRAGALRVPPASTGGFVDRLVERALGPRQRIVAEHLVGPSSWTGMWWVGLVLAAIAIAVAAAFPKVGALVLAMAVMVGAVSDPTAAGLGFVRNGSAWLPRWALQPITCQEVCGVLWRIGLVRWLAFLPVALAAVALLALVAGESVGRCVALAAGIGWIGVTLQPVFARLQVYSALARPLLGGRERLLLVLWAQTQLLGYTAGIGLLLFVDPAAGRACGALLCALVGALGYATFPWVMRRVDLVRTTVPPGVDATD